MTKEALKLALEALEASHFLIHGSETKGGLAFCMDGYYSGCFDIDSNDKQTNEAITAIKEALAQSEDLREENERLHVENRRLIDRIETMGVPVGVGGFATTTSAQTEEKLITIVDIEKIVKFKERNT
jgi:hypothetical protein